VPLCTQFASTCSTSIKPCVPSVCALCLCMLHSYSAVFALCVPSLPLHTLLLGSCVWPLHKRLHFKAASQSFLMNKSRGSMLAVPDESLIDQRVSCPWQTLMNQRASLSLMNESRGSVIVDEQVIRQHVRSLPCPGIAGLRWAWYNGAFIAAPAVRLRDPGLSSLGLCLVHCSSTVLRILMSSSLCMLSSWLLLLCRAREVPGPQHTSTLLSLITHSPSFLCTHTHVCMPHAQLHPRWSMEMMVKSKRSEAAAKHSGARARHVAVGPCAFPSHAPHDLPTLGGWREPCSHPL